jgi:hypothetical protein
VILAQCQVTLTLPAITAHQATVRILAEIVFRQDFLAGLDTDCISFLIEVVAA